MTRIRRLLSLFWRWRFAWVWRFRRWRKISWARSMRKRRRMLQRRSQIPALAPLAETGRCSALPEAAMA